MRIVILGGGISGLIAANVLSKFNPILLESASSLGGSFAAGGLKYIRNTRAVRALLTELQMPIQPYQPTGSLYWDGNRHDHPVWIRELHEETRHRIQREHWLKTRGESWSVQSTCMNDPMGEGSDAALRIDYADLVQRISTVAERDGARALIGMRVAQIETNRVICAAPEGKTVAYEYDLLIPTIQLGVLSRLAPWAQLPDGRPRPLTIAEFTTQEQTDQIGDYAYTPQLPFVSRIARKSQDEWWMEAPGIRSHEDMCEAFRALWMILGESEFIGNEKIIQGHLLPLPPGELVWPVNWYPIGRFAEWNSRSTTEKSLERALELLKWLG